MYDKCHFRPFLMLTAHFFGQQVEPLELLFGHSRLTQNPTDPDGKVIVLHVKLETVLYPTSF